MTLFIFVLLLALAGLVLLASLILARAFARRVVLPRSRTLIPASFSDTSVTLPRADSTEMPGEYGFWIDGGERHVRVGEVISSHEGTVTRAINRVTPQGLPLAAEGRWTGHAFASPEELGRPFFEVEVAGPLGVCPAWRFPGDPDGEVWAVHIHGIWSSRTSVLRSVAAFPSTITSLVVSYRADGEGPSTLNGAASLGSTEWRDVEAALAYAKANGAKRLILVGWSMGAAISLQLSERSAFRDLIHGLILVSPAVNPREVICYWATKYRLPRAAGRLAVATLGSRLLYRWVGVPEPIDFGSLDWIRPDRQLTVPALVIHSEGDQDIPLEHSQQFVAAHASQASIEVFEPAGHGMEWNRQPERFSQAISEWLDTLR